jgi:hypothetical protein
VSPPGQYSGILLGGKSVFKEILATEGAGALYRGAAPIMVRAHHGKREGNLH